MINYHPDRPEPVDLAGPADPLTPWPTASSFDTAVLAQYRISVRGPYTFEFAHIGRCGFSAITATRRLDLLCSTATAHAAICDGTGTYPWVNDPDPWTRYVRPAITPLGEDFE